MAFEKLDNDELLRLSLDAINNNNHADAVGMLKSLLERDTDHMFGTYLLAAEHAQIGMMDRAEEGFKRAVELGPDFPMARFQYGQILLVKGDLPECKAVLQPLTTLDNSLALTHFAKGMVAAADEQLDDAIQSLQYGLSLPQDIPVLADDMSRVLNNLHALKNGGGATPVINEAPAVMPTTSTPLYLSEYGKSKN
jgi:tetratricopeptide (TPR) repeat protein